VCNVGYEECEFLCAFETQSEAIEYMNRKWGNYDQIVIYQHTIGSKEKGTIVVSHKGFMTKC
jgi:hypothetical protein